ncbi:MAG: sigma-70 family RNA polymerase sigma factor [Actinomycetota bacterium]
MTESTAPSPPTSIDSFYADEYDGQLRRAYLMLGDRGAAHDAVHDAFAAVLARWDVLDAPGPYLNRCVLNACRDRANADARTTVGPVPELTVATSSLRIELWELLDELPFRQRAALVLRYYEGHTEREIAELLDVRPGTVGPLITRGLRRLRRSLR